MSNNKLSRFLITVALCCLITQFTASEAEGDYTVSRGRQILLDRGLQLQAIAFTYNPPGFSNISLWSISNFTTINFWTNQQYLVPSNSQWSRLYIPEAPSTEYLSYAENYFKDAFVSFQYGDEYTDLFTNPAKLPDMAATYREWNTLYPNTLAYTNFMWSSPTAPELTQYIQATQPDQSQWTCLGSRHDRTDFYGRIPLETVLRDVNTNILLVLYPLDIRPMGPIPEDSHLLRPEKDYPVWRSRLPEGYLMLDEVRIEFEQE